MKSTCMHLSLIQRSLLLLLSTLTTACATNVLLSKAATDLPDNQAGYILASYSVNCKDVKPLIGQPTCLQAFNSMSIGFTDAKDPTKLEGFGFVTGKMFGDDDKPDIAQPGEKIRFYCMRLPTGNYAFRSINYYNFAAGGSGYSLSKDQYLDIPFSVEPNTVKYIGAFKLLSSTGHNIFGMPLSAPGNLEISSQESRDVPLSKAKCNARAPMQIEPKLDPVTRGAVAAHPMLVIKK